MDARAHTPAGFELPPGTLGQTPFSWWSLASAGLSGALGAALGAVAVGASYLEQNVSENIPVALLAPVFAVYMVSSGALAEVLVRAGVLVWPRHPVLGATVCGALGGFAPGAFAAREFGSQPLPFVGALGIVLGALPLFLAVSLETSRSDGGRLLRPGLLTAAVLVLLGAPLALAADALRSVSMLEVLRAYLFLGLERVGGILGSAIGLLLGLVTGLTVLLDRALRTRRARRVGHPGSS